MQRWLDITDDVPEDKWQEVFRASGDCVCDVCHLPYWKHYQPIKATAPTVVVSCDGRWLKL